MLYITKKTFNIETVAQGRQRLIPDDETERRVTEALYLVRGEEGKALLTKMVNSF